MPRGDKHKCQMPSWIWIADEQHIMFDYITQTSVVIWNLNFAWSSYFIWVSDTASHTSEVETESQVLTNTGGSQGHLSYSVHGTLSSSILKSGKTLSIGRLWVVYIIQPWKTCPVFQNRRNGPGGWHYIQQAPAQNDNATQHHLYEKSKTARHKGAPTMAATSYSGRRATDADQPNTKLHFCETNKSFSWTVCHGPCS